MRTTRSVTNGMFVEPRIDGSERPPIRRLRGRIRPRERAAGRAALQEVPTSASQPDVRLALYRL